VLGDHIVLHLMSSNFPFVHELVCMCLGIMSSHDYVGSKYMNVGVHVTNETIKK
jgi:hypothetical protein